MSIRGRIAMGLVGLAMVAPAVRAGDPDDGTAAATTAAVDPAAAEGPLAPAAPDALVAPAAPVASASSAAAVVAVAKHTHKGLFGWRHCTECQRARIKSRDGVDIPAPPSLDPGVVPGGMAAAHGAPCPTCQGGRIMAPGDPHAPGIAAVGGDPSAPGIAVVNEMMSAEPTPVGMATARPHGFSGINVAGTAGPRPAMGAYDPLVAPAGIPPAQDVVTAPGHDHPHIIGHLFGIPNFGMMRRAQEDKERARHAAISYGQSNKPVTELPASVVYSNGSH